LSLHRYRKAHEGGRACPAGCQFEKLQGHGQGVRSGEARRLSQELRDKARLSNRFAGRRTMEITWRAALVSLLLFGLFVGVWHLATMGSGPAAPMDPEYAKLVGAPASQGKSAMPGPARVALKSGH